MYFKDPRVPILTRGATAMFVVLASHQIAFAQEATPTTDGDFLGTITLGESKRDVQTDTATPLTTIDQQEIDDRQASTIAELIDSVPGVTLVNGSTPIGSGINIRGFGANGTYGSDQKVAIQIDGASVGSEELYRIGTQLFTDPYLYKSVDVIRGTVGSFEYGSGIIGGVVRMETIDASDLTGGEPGFKFRQTLGGYTNKKGFSSSSTFAWQPTEDLELLANYSWREQNEQKDGANNDIPKSDFKLPSYLLKGRYTFGANEDHSIYASYSDTQTTERDVSYDSFNPAGFFRNVDRDTQSSTAAVGYTYSPDNDLIDLDFAFTYANQEIDSEATEAVTAATRASVIAGFIADGASYTDADVDAAVAQSLRLYNADHTYETTKLTLKNTSIFETGSIEQEVRYGVEFIKKERADQYAAPGGDDERFALFVVDNIDFGNGFSVTPAVRFESSTLNSFEVTHDDLETDAFMGGISGRYEFDSGFALFASFAHTESLPILDDLDSIARLTTTSTTRYDKPEVADTFEIGGSFDTSSVFSQDDALSLKANFYSTELDDVTSYSGARSIELQGLELEGSYATHSGLYMDMNANIMEGDEIRTSGETIDFDNVPANSVRFTFGKRFERSLDLSSEFIAAADKDTNGNKTPGHVTMNLRATITPSEGALEGTSFRFGIENAFDHKYTPELATRIAPGRNVKVTVSRAF